MLAEALVMDRTTLARNLKPLEKQELVKVVAGEDRRVHVVMLSDKGYAALARAMPLWQQAQAQIVEGVGQKRLGSLLEELSAITDLTHVP
jgi:DNA-binding MarR family transcriptional regulator